MDEGEKLRRALTLVNEAEGCIALGETARASRLLVRARGLLEYLDELRECAKVVFPTKAEITAILKQHKLVRFNLKPLRVFVVGSFARGDQKAHSDLDVLVEVRECPGTSAEDQTEFYRGRLRSYFMRHNIRGKADHLHPQWAGRRVDLYLTYDADTERKAKIELL